MTLMASYGCRIKSPNCSVQDLPSVLLPLVLEVTAQIHAGGCYGYGSLPLPYVLDCPSSLVREWLCTGYLMSSQIPTG